MKTINLFTELVKPSNYESVPCEHGHINYSLSFTSKQEKDVIERTAKSVGLPVQTIKIIYNLYFNNLFLSLTRSTKNEIYLGSYFKFGKLKNK